MKSQDQTNLLEAARALVSALETGDNDQIQQQMATVTKAQETELFNEVGKLTRDLHEALTSFNVDPRLVSLAEKDIPNTRERLTYVIESTEEAANKTLNFVDETLPLASELEENAAKLEKSWHRFRMREMNAEEFREMSKEIEAYLPVVKQHSEKIHQNLSEVTLAQGYQDLTGQVIRQVITMVEEVEDNLVALVKIAGTHQQDRQKDDTEESPIKAEGPQIGAKDNPKVVNNQDEVDDLLSSLGF
jgi:chemotaxis protein CheZ